MVTGSLELGEVLRDAAVPGIPALDDPGKRATWLITGKSGVASAMVNTAEQIGGSIGTAVFSSLAATQSRTISMPGCEDNPRKQQPATVS